MTTFPAGTVQNVADRLCDLNWNLPGDEALDQARDIVIDVTTAVDELRAAEHAGLSVRLSRPAAVFLHATVRHMNEVKILPEGAAGLETSAWLEEIEAATSRALATERPE